MSEEKFDHEREGRGLLRRQYESIILNDDNCNLVGVEASATHDGICATQRAHDSIAHTLIALHETLKRIADRLDADAAARAAGPISVTLPQYPPPSWQPMRMESTTGTAAPHTVVPLTIGPQSTTDGTPA